jgi:hypothetical protein
MPIMYFARKLERWFIYRVLHVDDTPHRIALGLAIGVFVTMTPTIGLQMLLVVALATLFRANKLVGVPIVWASNPLTVVPIYYPSFLLGRALLGERYSRQAFYTAVTKAFTQQDSWWAQIKAWYEATMSIFAPLWLGSIIVALLLGALTYVFMQRFIVLYRRQWAKHVARRKARKQSRHRNHCPAVDEKCEAAERREADS